MYFGLSAESSSAWRNRFNRGVDAVVELYNSVIGPELLANLFPQYHLTRLFQKQGKNLDGLFRQPYAQAVFPQLPCPQIQLKGAKPNDIGRAGGFQSGLRADFITTDSWLQIASVYSRPSHTRNKAHLLNGLVV